MSKSANRELIESELAEVTGGMLTAALVHAGRQIAIGSDGQGAQGGQNDPAQMFQQIMQQLTQGQG